MVKLLIGNKDIHTDINNFQFLQDDNKYEIITSNSGTNTIKKCISVKPQIIIINSGFSDIAFTDVINKLSALPEENNKCNLILTVNNPKDKMLLTKVPILYEIIDNPFNPNHMKNSINELSKKYNIPNINYSEIYDLLIDLELNVNSSGDGIQYLIIAIFKYYYFPEKYPTLNSLYKEIAEDIGDISQEDVKNRIRHTLDTLNTSYNPNELFMQIFKYHQDITAKRFITVIARYLHKIKSKK